MKSNRLQVRARCLFLAAAAWPLLALAEQPPTPQQLLDSAHRVSDLSASGAYVLHATVVVNPGGQSERRGQLTISRDHDRARVVLELDGRKEERVVSGDKLYVVPGHGSLFAVGLSEFDQSWDPSRPQKFAIRGKTTFGTVHAGKAHDRDVWCVDQKFELGKTRLCFDAVTSVLLRDGASDKYRKEFLDYATAGTQMYPQKVQVFRENVAPFEVDQISVTPAQLSAEVFKVPDNAIEVEGCENEQPPKAKYTPEPSFPSAARDAKRQTTVVLYVLITKEGKVGAVQSLSTDSYGFAQNAQDMVKTWRFKPGTCNGHPVATELNLEVDFKLY
jgi:TonB family protein